MEETDEFGALTVSQFCAEYGVGRTFFYEQVKAGDLVACKAGRKTLIRRRDAQRWAARLPRLNTASGELVSVQETEKVAPSIC